MSYSNLNRVLLIGRLTREPELRALPSGATVCNLRLACNGVRKTPEGEYHEKPNYFDVSVFGGRGETVHRYMHKGSRVAIDGRLDWSEWESADGAKRQGVEIHADRVQFLDNGAARANGDGSFDDGGEQHPSEDQSELVGAGAGIEDSLAF